MTKFILVIAIITLMVNSVYPIDILEATAALQAFCGTKTRAGTVEQIRQGTQCALDFAAENIPELKAKAIYTCHGPPGKESETEAKRCGRIFGVASDLIFMACSVSKAGGIGGLAKVPKDQVDKLVEKCFNY